MHPRDLRVENFAAYPPQGRSLVTANLNWLRCTPLLLMSLMLRPIIQYDGSLSAPAFPATYALRKICHMPVQAAGARSSDAAARQGGSLIDADMGASYTWIKQSRLAGAEQSRFLVWLEDHHLARAIAPPLPRGKISTAPTTMRRVLDWMA